MSIDLEKLLLEIFLLQKNSYIASCKEKIMTGNYIPISSWAEDDKPREKMVVERCYRTFDKRVARNLIRSGSGGESALDLSRRILTDASNDLNMLARLSVSDFMNRYKGVGMAKAASNYCCYGIGAPSGCRRQGRNQR